MLKGLRQTDMIMGSGLRQEWRYLNPSLIMSLMNSSAVLLVIAPELGMLAMEDLK